MSECPVCVYHAANVSSATLRGFECFNCGGDLGDHPQKLHDNIQPSKAYAVNPEAVSWDRFVQD